MDKNPKKIYTYDILDMETPVPPPPKNKGPIKDLSQAEKKNEMVPPPPTNQGSIEALSEDLKDDEESKPDQKTEDEEEQSGETSKSKYQTWWKRLKRCFRFGC